MKIVNLSEETKPAWRIKSVYGIILLLIFGLALAIRIFPLQDAVFGSGWVNFQGIDSWYHVRLIENLLQHFPQRIVFDPYTFYPYGQDVFFAPFFDWMIAFCAWVIGLGSPTMHTIEVVAAYFPAVLGALVTIPVYFIGKALFNSKTGLLSALIISILPSHFLTVSRLGFVDHHVAEVLLSSLSILFLILALKQLQEKSISLDSFKHREGGVLTRPLIYALLSGLSLGIYLLTWVGGVLVVFLFFCWAIVMFIVHHLRQENSDYISIMGVPIFLIALLMIIPFSSQLAYGATNLIALVIGILVLPVLSLISRFIASKNMPRYYYPLVLLGLGVIFLVIFYLVDSSLFISTFNKFEVFLPISNSRAISEVQPLFWDQGHFTFSRIWGSFNISAILAPVAFIMLITASVKKLNISLVFFLTWCALMFLATMGQVRFSAYLTINFALLSGYFLIQAVSWVPNILKWFEMKAPRASSNKKNKSSKVKNQPKSKYPLIYKSAYIFLAVIIIFLLGIYPSISTTKAIASIESGINPEWHDALIWMKNNTPDPFQNPDFFDETYTKTTTDGKYNYPASAYGVMNWWPYGHWITEIAHRIPVSNPHQYGVYDSASYFTGTDENTANQILDKLGAKYVLLDFDIAIPFDSNFVARRFPSIVTWVDKPLTQFCETYYQLKDGVYQPIILYYPEYYQCLSTRLYNFQGSEVRPQNSTIIISYTIESGRKIIQSAQTFDTYAKGQAYLEKQSSSNYRLVGTSPFISPIPLAKLDHYAEVYHSDSSLKISDTLDMPFLKIFQYNP